MYIYISLRKYRKKAQQRVNPHGLPWKNYRSEIFVTANILLVFSSDQTLFEVISLFTSPDTLVEAPIKSQKTVHN